MNRSITTDKTPKPFSNYSVGKVVEAGSRLVYVAGQLGVHPDGRLGADEAEQHELAWRNVLAVLEAAGMTAENLVDTHAYITNPASVPLYRATRDRVLAGAKPAATLLVVAGLADPKYLVEVSAVAAGPAK
jgi:enamine deaminase RidA (YjgF/YER057c/UK114 family)